ncbi:unnamed protein product [Bursaphelenchus xylophilus]|uniref:(pine wood nematode) hypothetical protein n=1 Tax=Bursaphelenchus xylophilus TaxID=6326 RepID=A0A1I7SV20_BURXY|nr:unnamed protein product [Bursaphelenchus xylophilus]CAG9100755.1 unnamed protein product [Bursaphelenchus xylophilus]
MVNVIRDNMLPGLDQLLASTKSATCSVRDLRWFDGIQLEHIDISHDWEEEEDPQLYLPMLLFIKTKKIIAGKCLPIHLFHSTHLPIQEATKILSCSLEPDIDQTAEPFYTEIFREMHRCLPNLEHLTITDVDIYIRTTNPEDHFGYRVQKMSEPYIRAVTKAAWHLRQIIEHAHIRTFINITFEVSCTFYMESCAELFFSLIPKIRCFESEYDRETDRFIKQIYFDDDRVRINLVIML